MTLVESLLEMTKPRHFSCSWTLSIRDKIHSRMSTTQNAVPLRTLARYFRCPELFKKVNEFVQYTLDTSTAATYLIKPYEADDDKLDKSVRSLILENFDQCNGLYQLPFELLRSLLSSPQLKQKVHSNASIHVNHYFLTNPELLNASSLKELTNNLTEIHVSVAESFLDMMSKLDPSEQDKESWLALDKLCKACSDALGSQWKKVDVETCLEDFHNPVLAGDYHGSGRLIISRLASALAAAQVESATKDHDIQQQQARIKSLQAELAHHNRPNSAAARASRNEAQPGMFDPEPSSDSSSGESVVLTRAVLRRYILRS